MEAQKETTDNATHTIHDALRAHALPPGARNVITTTHRRLIRQARESMTIKQVADHLGVAVTTISKYSSERAQAHFDEYQRSRVLSPEDREKRRVRAYKRWLAGRTQEPRP